MKTNDLRNIFSWLASAYYIILVNVHEHWHYFMVVVGVGSGGAWRQFLGSTTELFSAPIPCIQFSTHTAHPVFFPSLIHTLHSLMAQGFISCFASQLYLHKPNSWDPVVTHFIVLLRAPWLLSSMRSHPILKPTSTIDLPAKHMKKKPKSADKLHNIFSAPISGAAHGQRKNQDWIPYLCPQAWFFFSILCSVNCFNVC